MIAGATYTLPIDIQYPLGNVSKVIVTLKNETTQQKILKNYPNDNETYLMSDGRLGVRLSQQDTISLVGNVKVEAQINLASGAVAKTETKRVFVSPTLHTEMVEGATDNGEVYLEDVVLEIDAPITENANGGGVNFSIDDTLTVEGAAADAKAVGDRFAAQQKQIDSKQPVGDYALKNEIPVQSVNGKTGDVQLAAEDVGADAAGTADSRVGEHNVSEDAHNDIRLLISGLSSRLNALANSTDEDLDQLSEIVAYIKANKTLIDSITTSKVSVADIIDNLTTSVSDKPLSAKMGVKLKRLIDAIQIPTELPASDVYGWAKQPKKPTYTAEEVGAASRETVEELTETVDMKIGASELTNAVETALTEAKESGKFDGEDGRDGTSVTVSSVTESTEDGGSNVVRFSDGKTLTVKNGKTGADGKTPVKGADYFTADDKTEMINLVLAALPTWNGGSY